MTNLEMQKLMEDTIQKVIDFNCGDKGSGIIKMMNPEFLSCDYEKRELTTRFFIEKWELNPQGSMHGGLVSTAFDNTFGILTHFFAQGKFITTIDLATRYLKPIPEGCHLKVAAKSCSTGRTIITLVAEGYIEETGVLAATASANFMVFKDRQSPMKIDENE